MSLHYDWAISWRIGCEFSAECLGARWYCLAAMSSVATHYQVLGITRDASESDIRAAYHRKAKEVHPDRNGDDQGEHSPETATAQFQLVKEAYEVLSDQKTRSQYDRQSHYRPHQLSADLLNNDNLKRILQGNGAFPQPDGTLHIVKEDRPPLEEPPRKIQRTRSPLPSLSSLMKSTPSSHSSSSYANASVPSTPPVGLLRSSVGFSENPFNFRSSVPSPSPSPGPYGPPFTSPLTPQSQDNSHSNSAASLEIPLSPESRQRVFLRDNPPTVVSGDMCGPSPNSMSSYSELSASSQPDITLNLHSDLQISFQESMQGCTKRIVFDRKEQCFQCVGEDARNCPSCGGFGLIRVEASVDIRIPAGVPDGCRKRLIEQGDTSLSGRKGDLIITVKVEEHPFLRRRNVVDVICDLPVSFEHAALGVTLQIPSLRGQVRVGVFPLLLLLPKRLTTPPGRDKTRDTTPRDYQSTWRGLS